MKDLAQYLVTDYDWRVREAAMNRFPHFKARVEDYDIHFIHVIGSGTDPTPIVVTHGWPGSFVEFLKVIDRLAHPEQYGGDPEDGFTVIAPSIPGFGFSSKPRRPINSRDVARLWDTLMTDTLGYGSYIATDEDKAAMARWGEIYMAEGGYIHIQSTKPLTLSYAMTDSPLGVMACIFEKMKTWSDIANDDPWSVYTRDEVLDNIMIYLVTNTFATASWMYAGAMNEPPVPPEPIAKPTAIAHFPHELVFWPKTYAERQFRLVRWTDMPEGGHFAALEKPKLFADDVLAFGKMLRA